MTTLTKEEILQAILDKKQLQEWDGIDEGFFNITENQALSNIVHGKVVSMRTKPEFQYLHYFESEINARMEIEVNREENKNYVEELEQEIKGMFERVMYTFFGTEGNTK